jgi:hypothetical protein
MLGRLCGKCRHMFHGKRQPCSEPGCTLGGGFGSEVTCKVRCPQCLHAPHPDEKCPECTDVPKRAKCTVHCPVCSHPGRRTAHRTGGCTTCKEGEQCNLLAAEMAKRSGEGEGGGGGEGEREGEGEDGAKGDDDDEEEEEEEEEEEAASHAAMATLAETLEVQQPDLMADALQIVTEVTTTEELPRAVAFYLDDVEHPKDQGDEEDEDGAMEQGETRPVSSASSSGRGGKAKASGGKGSGGKAGGGKASGGDDGAKKRRR